MRLISVQTNCPLCGSTKEFRLEQAKFMAWQYGGTVQSVFPELDDGDRERLITGICPHCYAEVCMQEEDKEDTGCPQMGSGGIHVEDPLTGHCKYCNWGMSDY